MENERSTSYLCRFCKGSFSQPQDLYNHVQKIHTVRNSTKENRLCPLCGLQCQKHEDYQKHLRHLHGKKEDGQVFTFKCFNDFLVWKNELEKRIYCKYVLKTPYSLLSSPKVQNEKIHIFQCDSSTPGLKEKKAKSKMTCDNECPSVISAIEFEKSREIRVEYWSTHKGHIVSREINELDAAINSIEASEMALNENQRYQTDTEENIFFMSESNDGSFSNAFGDETQKKKKVSLFKSKSNSRQRTSKSFQKLPYKKDTTSKKVGSFQYSLASVACMKSIKKSSDSTFIPVINATSSAVTENSISVLNLTPDSDLSSKNGNEATTNQSSNPTQNDVLIPSTNTPSTKKSSLNVQSTPSNLTLLNGGTSSGQLVILNSLPGTNNIQNLILYPSGTNLSSTLSEEQKSSKRRKKASTKDLPQSAIITSTEELPSEKENTSSVQNVQGSSDVNKNETPSRKPLLKKQKTTGKIQSPKKIAAKPFSTPVTDPNNISSSVQSFISINPPVNASSTTTASIVNPSSLSSLPAGQAFMSINNNLIPIINTTQPFLPSNVNSGFVLASTLSPPVTQSSQSLVNLTPLAPCSISSVAPSNAEANETNTTAASTNVQNMSGTNSVPLIVLPSTEKVINSPSTTKQNTKSVSTTPVLGAIKSPVVSIASGIVQNPVISSVSPQPSKVMPVVSSPLRLPNIDSDRGKPLKSNLVQSPLILSRGPFLSSAVIQRGAQIISSPLLPSNAKFIPSPLLSSNLPKSLASGGSKSKISTAMSNKAQSHKISMSSSSSITNSLSKSTTSLTARPSISESNKMNTIVLNTEPISSTPTISMPAFLGAKKKPEPLFFESEGNVYMLEPVENTPEELNSTASLTEHKIEALKKTENGAGGNPVLLIEEKDETPKDMNDDGIDGDQISIADGTDGDQVSIADSDADEITIDLTGSDQKADGKSKLPSPIKVTDVKNGVQIKSVVQAKRPLKDDDDVEILKKVKYYQLEMKYLSSQAECKRLRLELLKAEMKNKNLQDKEESPSISENLDKEVIDKDNVEEKSGVDKLKSIDLIQHTDVHESKEVQPMDTDTEETKTDSPSVKENYLNKLVEPVIEKEDSSEKKLVESVLVKESEAMNPSSDDQVLESIVLDEAVDVNNSSGDEQIEDLVMGGSVDMDDSDQQDSMDRIILDEESVASVNSKDSTEISKESLKKMEEQYGGQNPLDIYTMIRSSVLRSLYEDMKGLCQENKKLFEELQKFKAQDKLLKIFKEELVEAEL